MFFDGPGPINLGEIDRPSANFPLAASRFSFKGSNYL